MTSVADHLIGDSPAFLATLRGAAITAATDVNVLIVGESGTGKELLAKLIHQRSCRADKAFITINCAALPENLAESELFGHRKGAFTGASQDQGGRIQAAAGGTLFLDEIAELNLNVQAKLLRFLESRECQPIGQARTECVDVRIVAATNRDLYHEVQHGRFREDLYYRLNVVPLLLPPLRERGRDIALLTNRITARLAMQHRLDTPRYAVRAMELLQQYAWPGNVRELRNVCERMVILFPGRTIEAENLPVEIRQAPPAQAGATFQLPENGIQLEQVESSLIRQALDKARGNQSKAARLLGLSRGTLIYRMKKFALN
ncbi:MAG: sigma-54 dependent transcriptional regulator [Proteobacteria bacterium]|jgi:transcriptional regulator with GAF, ATPase, and Fis domain|nr:sigma-54 dependent transcriptional regulator [Pseudomonadota bacterium]